MGLIFGLALSALSPMVVNSLTLPPISTERALILLEHGELTKLYGLLPWGSNYTFLVSVQDEEYEVPAIYKPRRGERPLWDFPAGTLCLRERAAFLVSEALGWCFVPPTVLRDGPQGFGSLQLYIPHDPDQHYFTFGGKYRSQLRRIALFDHVVNNADRKGGHCLVDQAGKVWAIDHGVCFSAQPKLRTVIWDFVGERIPRKLREDVRRLCRLLETDSTLLDTLRELLSEREIEALRHRAARLVESGVFPEPGPGRGYPWPPV